MFIVIGWIVLTIILTVAGEKREIGGLATFFISLIFSPIVGFIVVILSEKKETVILITKDGQTSEVYFNVIDNNVGYIRQNSVTKTYEVREKISRKESVLHGEFNGFIEAKEYIISLFEGE